MNSASAGRALFLFPLLTGLIGSACSSPKAPPPERVPVRVTRVVLQPAPYEVEATGTAEALHSVAVLPQVGGTLLKVDFTEGDEVHAGQELFRIDPRPSQAALAQAEAMLHRDQANATGADADAQRYAGLVKQDYVTAQQYEQVTTTAAALRSTLAADSAAVENARLNLEYTTIRAPIGGRTGGLLLRAGNLVRTGGTAPLVTINQIRPILVRFAVPAAQLGEIQRQRQQRQLPVRARTAAGDSVPSGALVFVDNAVDSTTGTVMLKAQFANTDDALWPGAYVNVRLQLLVNPRAIRIPSAAVLQSQQGQYVYLVGTDGGVTNRPVRTAWAVGSDLVVDQGLKEGDQVVVDGQSRVSPGIKVQIVRGDSTAAADSTGSSQ
ncbi:MAG: efflux RND transporter periplasmic adaptor subunit [Gemmatimonadota bacterium]